MTNTKITWKFLKQFNYKNPPKIGLKRSHQVTKEYETYKNNLFINSIDINNYINNKYFSNTNQFLYIDENQFPYYCVNNIKHYVITCWINYSFY